MVTFFAIDSCLDQGGRWDYKDGNCDESHESKKAVNRKPSSGALTEKLDIINYSCAVLIRPNSRKIEKLKNENTEDDYNTIVDDNEYYMATSAEYLDSVKVKRIERDSEGSISFKTAKGVIFKIDMNSLYWGILLFYGKAKPVKADMTYINQDYESYIKK